MEASASALKEVIETAFAKFEAEEAKITPSTIVKN